MQGKISIIILALFLSGCELVTASYIYPAITYFTVDKAVEAKTGKNITDNVLSGVSKKDCKISNVFREEEKVCKELNKDVK